jgi:hypothetical protein
MSTIEDKEQPSGSLFSTINSGAMFSDCRKYRYALWRIWDKKERLAMFIGLNPSTAKEDRDDRTIERIRSIVKGWGYGGFYMMNLFAIVSKKPSILKTHPDPLGDNDGWIEKIAPKCQMIVFAWGNFKEAKERSNRIVEMFPDAHALHINKNGSPKHPLYCPIKTLPVKFKS